MSILATVVFAVFVLVMLDFVMLDRSLGRGQCAAQDALRDFVLAIGLSILIAVFFGGFWR